MDLLSCWHEHYASQAVPHHARFCKHPKGEKPKWSVWFTFALHLSSCTITSGLLQQSSRAKSKADRPFCKISTLILALTFLLKSNPEWARNGIIDTSLDKIAHSTGPMPLMLFADSKESNAKSCRNLLRFLPVGGSPTRVSYLATVKRYMSHWPNFFSAPIRFCNALFIT